MVGTRPAAEKIDYFLGGPLAIGPVEVPNRVVLAPMSGITDAPFLVWRKGLELAWWSQR
jgi:tRNA-dihydrouridine synthase B